MTFTVPGGQRQLIPVAHFPLVAQTDLSLIEAFPRIKAIAARRLARTGLIFGLRQSTRIVGIDGNAVKHQRQRTDVVKPHAELPVAQAFLRAAVIAEAVGGKAGTGEGVIDIPRLRAIAGSTAGFYAVAPGTKAAKVGARFQRGRLAAGGGINIHHATGGIAIQCRVRPAQHFYLAHRIYIDV